MHWAAGLQTGRMCWDNARCCLSCNANFQPSQEQLVVFWPGCGYCCWGLTFICCRRDYCLLGNDFIGRLRTGRWNEQKWQTGRQSAGAQLGAACIRSAMEVHWRIWKEPGWMVSKPCWFVFRKWKLEQKKLLLGNDICKSAWRGGKVNAAAAAGICWWLKLKVFGASERPRLKSETDGAGRGCGFVFFVKL